jgi:hypothetical protein
MTREPEHPCNAPLRRKTINDNNSLTDPLFRRGALKAGGFVPEMQLLFKLLSNCEKAGKKILKK